ncbi:ATP-binding protein [Desertivirga xinjiangensis]|uniref:ATP-binding protein n=1 Tax=Desertivirga xinjiangensis TaxID=539206 RepID=UPI00210AD84D|nr:ATP-binding protein [Pedobacter xinjiangensis]
MGLNLEVFKYFFDKATIGIKIMEPNGTIVYVNNAETELIGFSEQELLGRHFSDFLPEADKAKKFFDAIKKFEALDEFRTKLIRADNSQIDISLDTSVNTRDGVVESVCCFTRDISTYKRNADLLHFLNLAGSELALTYDTESALEKVSQLVVPSFATWFCIDIVKGGKVEVLKIAHQNPEYLQWAYAFRRDNPVSLEDDYGIGKVLRTGKVSFTPVVDELILNNGFKHPMRDAILDKLNPQSVIIVPMHVKEELKGAISFVNTGKYYEISDLYFAQDFANRIALALENAKLYEEAKAEISRRIKAEQKKDEFISMASHELKTPLTSIKAYNQLLEKKMQEHPEAITFLRKASVHILQLERLISDLLDVSKINAGKLTYNIGRFNLGELLEESVESVQHLSCTHKITIEETVDTLLTGDRLRIEQVLTNMLTNAIKYSPNANRVIVKAREEQDHVVVSVQDFGIGIARQDLKKIFGRFYRIGSSSMKYSGLGLGLFIASEILKKHQGVFWIESEVDKGSTFYFKLPRNVVAEENVVT